MCAQPLGEGMDEVSLSPEENVRLWTILGELVEEFGVAENPEFLRQASGMADLLPSTVHEKVLDMRYHESCAALVIRRGPAPDRLAPTPLSWRDRPPRGTVEQDMWLLLVLSLLGDPMAWSYLQDGRILNDIVPEKGAEDTQTGQSSSTELDFHVEEADHDVRAQAFGLLCLRNPDRVPTTVATASMVDLDGDDVDVLFEPRFRIGDEERFRTRPVLFGHEQSPYLRVDPPYTRAVPGDTAAVRALNDLVEQLGRNLVDVVLESGDLLIVDNYRSVHGRRPFRARYDGNDRWLRRASVVRDLRKLREFRTGVDGRVVTPDLTQ